MWQRHIEQSCEHGIGEHHPADRNGGESDLAVFAVLIDDPIAGGVTEIINGAVLDASNASTTVNVIATSSPAHG